uniref:Sfi1 spindle body domain-containing protein n=1 Tax=Pyrodinium bahamense TaxID=73915 RepID=A0A7S0FAT0_9DINO
MTARKVAEVERLLLRELEEALLSRAASLARLFHTWRCEATVLRTGRQFEEEFEREKGGWEERLVERRSDCEDRLLDGARATAQRQAKWRQALALLLDQWAHGDAHSIQSASIRAWRDLSRAHRTLKSKQERVKMVVGVWAEGEHQSQTHMCFRDWHRQALQMKESRKRQLDFDLAKESRDQLLRAEAARCSAQVDAASQDLGSCRVRARKDVLLIATVLDRGQLRGVAYVAMQAWQHCTAWARMTQRQRRAALQVAPLFFQATATNTLRSGFIGWRALVQRETALRGETKRWEAVACSERASRGEHTRSREEVAGRCRATARRTAALAARCWGAGETASLLREVLTVWRLDRQRKGIATRRHACVHAALLRWAGGDHLGIAHDCLLHWKAQAAQRRLAHRHGEELGRCVEEWEGLVAEERARREASEAQHSASVERLHGRAGAVVEHALTCWEGGRGKALMRRVLRCWRPRAHGARHLGRGHRALHAALQQVLSAGGGALLRACALAWWAHTKQVKVAQAAEGHLAEERSLWESGLEREREACANNLRMAREGGELRRVRGCQVTELMLRQWHSGGEGGLLAAAFISWLQLKSTLALWSRRRRVVLSGVLRLCEGDKRAALHLCLLDWRHRAKLEAAHRGEVLERDARIVQLREGSRALLAQERARLQECVRLVMGAEGPALTQALLGAWRAQAAEARAGEAQRRLQVALEERRRAGVLATAQRRALASAALRLLGLRDGRSVALGCLLRWAQALQAARRERAQNASRSALEAKHARFLQRRALQQDRAALLAACLWELLREARLQRHARERTDAQRGVQEATALLLNLRDERGSLDEQLHMAYRQVDLVTETLQKELRTKEELASELREVYDKLRKQSASQIPGVGEVGLQSASRICGTSRPSSAKSGMEE